VFKLFPPYGGDKTKSIDYGTQYKATCKLLEKSGIVSKAKTHSGRGGGSRMAELRGADENQIRRAGRWTNGALTKCYLTHLPRKVMRALGGHPVDTPLYFLSRDVIKPPSHLQEMIFPEVDVWLARLESGSGCEPNIAAGGFLNLMKYLRVFSITLLEQNSTLTITYRLLFCKTLFVLWMNILSVTCGNSLYSRVQSLHHFKKS
jgi:hypothetical protein